MAPPDESDYSKKQIENKYETNHSSVFEMDNKIYKLLFPPKNTDSCEQFYTNSKLEYHNAQLFGDKKIGPEVINYIVDSSNSGFKKNVDEYKIKHEITGITCNIPCIVMKKYDMDGYTYFGILLEEKNEQQLIDFLTRMKTLVKDSREHKICVDIKLQNFVVNRNTKNEITDMKMIDFGFDSCNQDDINDDTYPIFMPLFQLYIVMQNYLEDHSILINNLFEKDMISDTDKIEKILKDKDFFGTKILHHYAKIALYIANEYSEKKEENITDFINRCYKEITDNFNKNTQFGRRNKQSCRNKRSGKKNGQAKKKRVRSKKRSIRRRRKSS